jgi:hypothetical protein
VTALALSLLWKLWPAILAVGGALLWGFRQRQAGAAKERAKQAEAEAKARDIADQVDNDLTLLTPEQKRKELGKWSPKS